MTPIALHYFWFAYYNGLRRGRSLKPHHVRDGAAFPEFTVPLQRRGYEYGGLVPNGPPTWAEYEARRAEVEAAEEDGGRHNIEDVATYAKLDESFLTPGSKAIVVGRPPMNDLDHGDKVHSQPGFTTLEQKIFRILRVYLDICSRSHVRLAEALAKRLSGDHANRADATFRQVQAPWYKDLTHPGGRTTRVPREAYRTAAYVFHLTGLASLHGADLFVAFGMGGTQTLVLAHRLRTDLDWVFDEPGFTMFELTAPDEEVACGGPEHAARWSFDTLLRTECLAEPEVRR